MLECVVTMTSQIPADKSLDDSNDDVIETGNVKDGIVAGTDDLGTTTKVPKNQSETKRMTDE